MKFAKSIAPAFLLFTLLLSSCVKPKDDYKEKDDVQQHNEDVNNTKSESDNLNTDINNVLRNASGFQKKEGVNAYDICGATIDDSHQNDAIPTLYINFNGASCGNPARKRSGQVKVELIAGNRWGDANSKLRVTHINYKVVFVNLNNHYLVFNGTKYLTNLVAVDWVNVYLTGTLNTQVRERSYDVTVQFENGETESWNCARLTDVNLSYQSATSYNYSVTVNADTVINGKNIDSWGTTRYGTNFLTEMIVPWKSGTTCGWLRPTQGKYRSTTDNFTVTATASVDQNGNVVSGCGAYGYFLEWQYTNGSNTASGDLVINYF